MDMGFNVGTLQLERTDARQPKQKRHDEKAFHEAFMDRIEKLKNGEVNTKFQTGSGEYTIDEWDELLKKFDEAENDIKEEVKENIEKRKKLNLEKQQFEKDRLNVAGANENLTLHISNEDGEKSIGAWCDAVNGTSVTVYKPEDFDASNPIYHVKIWDKDGNVTERMVDIAKINPQKCDSYDMFTYASHLSDQGEYKDAQTRFMMTHAHLRDLPNNQNIDLDEEINWLQIVSDIMKEQYELNNRSSYLGYKKFFEYLQKIK